MEKFSNGSKTDSLTEINDKSSDRREVLSSIPAPNYKKDIEKLKIHSSKKSQQVNPTIVKQALGIAIE